MTDIESLLNAYETRKAARDAALRSKKLVLVEWLDSHHRAGWTTEPPATTALTCLSVGWLTCDGDEAKTLTPT